MKRFPFDWLLLTAIGFIILLPKFDLIDISGTTTAIRVEDFVVAAIYIVWLGWLSLHRKAFRLTIVHKLMILAVLAGLISTIVGLLTKSVPSVGLGLLSVLRRVEYFGMFWVAYSWLSTKNLKKYILALLGISGVVLSIGILQFYQFLPMFSTWEGYSGKVLYFDQNFGFLISTFAGHYDLGGYLILMTSIVLAMIFFVQKWKWRLPLLALLLGYYFLLHYSYSRAAYGAILVELLVFFILAKRYWYIFFPIIDMARVGWLYISGKFSRYSYDISIVHPSSTLVNSKVHIATKSAIAVKPTPAHGVYSTLQLQNGSELTLDPGGATRVDVWHKVWRYFIQNPLLGTGYGGIGVGADNQYLRWLGEVGILGLLANLGLIGVVWFRLYRAVKRLTGVDYWFILALLAGIVGLLAQATLIDIFDSSKVASLLWFLVGLGVVITESEVDRQ